MKRLFIPVLCGFAFAGCATSSAPTELDLGLAVARAPVTTPDKFANSGFVDDDIYLHQKLTTSAGHKAQARAAAALARLTPFAKIDGIAWRVTVINSTDPVALAVPDGTLFVSDGLVRNANDDEIATIVAHLMGHVSYSHYDVYRDYHVDHSIVAPTDASVESSAPFASTITSGSTLTEGRVSSRDRHGGCGLYRLASAMSRGC
jgi:hypothetical protein